jgi:hypothetical protein
VSARGNCGDSTMGPRSRSRANARSRSRGKRPIAVDPRSLPRSTPGPWSRASAGRWSSRRAQGLRPRAGPSSAARRTPGAGRRPRSEAGAGFMRRGAVSETGVRGRPQKPTSGLLRALAGLRAFASRSRGQASRFMGAGRRPLGRCRWCGNQADHAKTWRQATFRGFGRGAAASTISAG